LIWFLRCFFLSVFFYYSLLSFCSVVLSILHYLIF
jgi:hypothetical protein